MARSHARVAASASPLTARKPARLWLDVWGSWLAAPAFKESLGVWGITRAMFVLLTYFGVILFHSRLHYNVLQSFAHSLLPAWDKWDTKWYLNIARRGYAWKAAAGTSPTAFFPLYPLLIRVGVTFSHRSYLSVALVLSNLSFLAALVYLWQLAAWELGKRVAGRTVLYIATFPTALFFFAGYTESLFLLLTVASFYHLRRHDWLWAGAFGALASATRVTGILLLAPFAYEYARACNFSPRRMVSLRLLGLLLVPMGLIAFMAELRYSVGDAWAFTHSQAAWQKVFTVRLWAGLIDSVRQLWVLPSASFYEAHNVINLAAALLFLAGTVLAARKLPAAYTLYLVAFWLVTLSSPALAGGYPVPLISMSRYVMVLFPVFLYFGFLGERRWFHDAYLVLAPSLLALFTVQFLLRGWII